MVSKILRIASNSEKATGKVFRTVHTSIRFSCFFCSKNTFAEQICEAKRIVSVHCTLQTELVFPHQGTALIDSQMQRETEINLCYC